MALELRLACGNCDERIVASYVMVRRLRRSHAPSACAWCGDLETVAHAMNAAVDPEGRRQPLLLDVRRDEA